MPTPTFRLAFIGLIWGALALLAWPFESAATAETPDSDGARLFREKIAPVLKAECFRCHSAEAAKLCAGLRLDSREALLEGGDSGPAIVPGKSGESLLIQAIRHEDGMAMPPKKPRLSEAIVTDIAKWVDLGAPYPAASGTQSSFSATIEQARSHWAFQPVKKPVPPTVQDLAWVHNPIDAFVLSKLEERRWHPSAPAERADWLRRVTFDVTGLPPAPEDIAAFVADPSPDADERVVNRLLASPRYGQRWGQHWLDLVRFAESEGFEYDRHIPDGWRYRDYVIDSLNRDKPFDRFVVEQIAGDELAPGDPESQTASIFHRLGPVRRNAGNPEIALSRNEVLTERTDILGTTFLGLTVGCARCHNHKLEPISQKDYYRLQAFLAATDEHDISLSTPAQRKAWEENKKRVQAEIKKLQAKSRKASGTEKSRLAMEIEAMEDSIPPPPSTIPAIWNDSAHRTPIHVLKRGVWENKGEPVGPRPPSVLVADDLPELPPNTPDPRSRLARWLVSPAQPLTARVIVNRLWQYHFGMGLVKTVNDFGTKGDRPSHPELLDWLASTLVENGWRLKPIHRLILLSGTYRQSNRAGRGSPDRRGERPGVGAPGGSAGKAGSTPATPGDSGPRTGVAGVGARRATPPGDPQGSAVLASDLAARDDPENRLLWRFNRRRLEAEEIRDAMLAVSGRLNVRAGGASVMVPVAPGIVRLLLKPSQWQVAHDHAEYDRRSIYLIAKRNLRLPFLETFDAPALLTSCSRRESSTHAPQALELLNGSLSNDLAEAFANRLRTETSGEPRCVVDRAYRLALGRPPTPREQALALAFLRDQPLREFTLALFNLNGFLYVP